MFIAVVVLLVLQDTNILPVVLCLQVSAPYYANVEAGGKLDSACVRACKSLAAELTLAVDVYAVMFRFETPLFKVKNKIGEQIQVKYSLDITEFCQQFSDARLFFSLWWRNLFNFRFLSKQLRLVFEIDFIFRLIKPFRCQVTFWG